MLSVFFTIGLCFSVVAQSTSPDNSQNYSGEKLSFSYPANWKITDKSTQKIQQLNLVPESGNALIMVIAYRPKISTQDEFEQVKVAVTQPYIEKISKGFVSSNRTQVCTKTNDLQIPGFRITGLYNQEESASDIFSFVMDGKFFNLIYMRANKESSKTDLAWNTINKTLKVKDQKSDKSPLLIIDLENDAVINSKAIKLPKPIFPSTQRTLAWFKYTETVEVRVTIDEHGDVISAKAISGNPRLQPAAIQAAKQAKFTPAYLCGELSKFSGIIVYNFVHD
jgi:hypothetical protein